MSVLLGISAYYHDSAAALIQNGNIVCAAQEERFTRKKNDASFPVLSIKECLKRNNLQTKKCDELIYFHVFT